MKKRIIALLAVFTMGLGMLGGCGTKNADTDAQNTTSVQKETGAQKESSAQEESSAQSEAVTNKDTVDNTATLEDGTYTAKFNTDSSMFHVNEADGGCGTLTVKDGKMTMHIRLVSKKIVNLYVGTAEDAAKDGAELLQPTTEEVTYGDGTTEEVYAFDVPVQALDQEFDLAILGTKGTWYDHKVSVSDAQKVE